MDKNEQLFNIVSEAMGAFNTKRNDRALIEDPMSKPRNIYQEPSTQDIVTKANVANMIKLSKMTKSSVSDISGVIENIKSKVNPSILKKALMDIENPGNPLIVLCPQIHKGETVNGMKMTENIIVDPVITSWNLGGVEFVNATRLKRDLLANNRELVKGYILNGKLMRDLRNDAKRKIMYSTSVVKPALAIIFSYMILRILLKKSIIKADKIVDQAIMLYGLQKWYIYNQLALKTDSAESLKIAFANTLQADKKMRDKCPESVETLEDLWQEVDGIAVKKINEHHNISINSLFEIKNFIVFYFAISATIKDEINSGTHSYALFFLSKLMHVVDMNSNIIKAYGKECYLFTDKPDILIVAILNIAELTNVFTSKELRNALKNEAHIQKLTIAVIKKIKEAY